MAESIDIKVKALPNTIHDISISRQATVRELKQLLGQRTQMPEDRQRLIYYGRVLSDDTRLEEAGIESGHTLHLVERNPAAPPLQETTTETAPPRSSEASGTTRISVSLGPGAPQAMHDIGRIVQGVLNTVGMGAANNPTPQGPPIQASGTGTVGSVAHLVLSLGRYLTHLETGGLQTRGIPLISLAPRGSHHRATESDTIELTASICQVLSNQSLAPQLQSQLQTARARLDQIQDETSGAHTRVTGQETRPHGQESSEQQSPTPYVYIPLLLATFYNVIHRSETLLREKLSRSFANVSHLLENVTEVDETNLELLTGGVRQIGSIANWYAALLVELARLASGVLSAMRGDVCPLALNTGAVISSDGTAPMIPPLLPQGPRQGRTTVNQSTDQGSAEQTQQGAQTQSSAQQGRPADGSPPLSFRVEQSGDMSEADIMGHVVPAIEQMTMALINRGGDFVDQIVSALGERNDQQTQQTATTEAAPTPSSPPAPVAPEAPAPVPPPQTEPSPVDTSSAEGTSGGPVGLSTGLGPRPRTTQGNAPKRTALGAPGHTQAEKTAKTQAETETTCRQALPQEGIGSLMRSVADGLSGNAGGGQGGGGGLERMIDSLATGVMNNSNIHRIAENPAIQNVISSATDPETGAMNMGRVMGEMGPFISSLMQGMGARSQSATAPSTANLADLPSDRVAEWRLAFEQDTAAMENTPPDTSELSLAYLAGRVTQSSTSQGILPPDSDFD